MVIRLFLLEGHPLDSPTADSADARRDDAHVNIERTGQLTDEVWYRIEEHCLLVGHRRRVLDHEEEGDACDALAANDLHVRVPRACVAAPVTWTCVGTTIARATMLDDSTAAEDGDTENDRP